MQDPACKNVTWHLSVQVTLTPSLYLGPAMYARHSFCLGFMVNELDATQLVLKIYLAQSAPFTKLFVSD